MSFGVRNKFRLLTSAHTRESKCRQCAMSAIEQSLRQVMRKIVIVAK